MLKKIKKLTEIELKSICDKHGFCLNCPLEIRLPSDDNDTATYGKCLFNYILEKKYKKKLEKAIKKEIEVNENE